MTPTELHAAIMAIPCNERVAQTHFVNSYKAGHRDALKAAAALVSEYADSLPRWHAKPTVPGIWIELYDNGALDIWHVEADELADWQGGKVCGPWQLPPIPEPPEPPKGA